MPDGIPFELKEYIELADITGRCIREDKSRAHRQQPTNTTRKIKHRA